MSDLGGLGRLCPRHQLENGSWLLLLRELSFGESNHEHPYVQGKGVLYRPYRPGLTIGSSPLLRFCQAVTRSRRIDHCTPAFGSPGLFGIGTDL